MEKISLDESEDTTTENTMKEIEDSNLSDDSKSMTIKLLKNDK
ncbi:MAG: hypothetical protein R6U26_00915 [Candidatus Undinarchaeales archaeon]